MSYISGARSVPDEQVRIASTKMDGIGPKKAIQVRYRLGISGNIKMNELTKYQIDQMEQMIGQDHVVHWELKRGGLTQVREGPPQAFLKCGRQERSQSDSRSRPAWRCWMLLINRKRRKRNRTFEMLEGAKSMGAGARMFHSVASQFYSLSATLYMGVLWSRKLLLHFFLSPPLRRLPKGVRLNFEIIFKVFFGLLISKLALSLGYLWMDELSKAVAPFLPSLGGMNGVFGSPQTPPPHSGLFEVLGLEKDSVNDPGESSNTGSENRAEDIAELLTKQRYDKLLADCHIKEDRILNSPLIHEEFERAGRDFPQTAPLLSKENALRKVLKEVITSDKGRRGMNPDADMSELRIYKVWLSRICNRLSEEEKSAGYGYHQMKIRKSDVVIVNKIYATYKQWNDPFRNDND